MLVLDIETTGLPQTKGFGNYYSPKEIFRYNTSRVVSIACITEDGYERYSMIKPNDFTIHNSHFHGITQKRAVEKGLSLREYFSNDLLKKIKETDFILGHNIHFDIHVLLSELYRQGLYSIYSLLEHKKLQCSMKLGQDYFQLKKSPKLTNYNTNFVEFHQ